MSKSGNQGESVKCDKSWDSFVAYDVKKENRVDGGEGKLCIMKEIVAHVRKGASREITCVKLPSSLSALN